MNEATATHQIESIDGTVAGVMTDGRGTAIENRAEMGNNLIQVNEEGASQD